MKIKGNIVYLRLNFSNKANIMKTNSIITQTILSFFLIGILASCSNKNQFTIEGNVTNGAGKTIYLENITTSSIVMVDSAKLNNSGSFKFNSERPSAPDFYRLRLNNQFINLAIDSTETVKIQADTLNFARNYTVEGSIECEKIKELTLLQLSTNEAYKKLQKKYDSKEITTDEYMQELQAIIDSYKNTAKEYILSNMGSPSAYFALFQQINHLLIFDPYDKSDSKLYGAVANAWNQYYPEVPRTQHLVNLFKNSLVSLRGEKEVEYDANEIDGKDFFDISLRNNKNQEVRLSEIGKGKVVLVDFIAYEMAESPAHNIRLGNVYEKYKNQGFEIYQISLDTDTHFWKNAAGNLPWICVNDPQSIYSEILVKYNVATIPCGYIFDKEGEIVKKVEDYNNLEKDILPYLK